MAHGVQMIDVDAKSLEKVDVFEAVYIDVPIRDQRDTMESPFFGLSKSRNKPIHYVSNRTVVTVTPMEKFGIATIWDADILIWLATQLNEAINRGEEPSREIHFHPHALLKAIRRGVGGQQYERLKQALRRLASTYVQTNIRASEDRKRIAEFHWIDGWEATEQNGKPTGMSIVLSRWVYSGIVQKGGVLSIDPAYFELTGGFERWLYRVARKHAGHQAAGWNFTMKKLYQKSGSSGEFRNFAIEIRKVVAGNSLPEYALSISRSRAGEEVVHIAPRVLLDEG